MAKIRLSKYKYSAYVFVDSKFGKDYLEHPEAYKVEKELRSKR